MLEEWADAIRESVEERNRLRIDLDQTKRALVKLADENGHMERQMRALQRKLAEEQLEHRVTLSHNADLRRDLEHTQTLYREATEQVFGMRLRIRFLEDIAHKTGHIVRMDSGPHPEGTK